MTADVSVRLAVLQANRQAVNAHPTRTRNRRGFTLAEIIAAIALLAVFSVIVAQLFAAAHTLAQRTDRLDGAVLCARNLAETWQARLDAAPEAYRTTPAPTAAVTPAPTAAVTPAPAAASLPNNPFTGIGTLRMGTIARLGFDSNLRPVAATDARAVYLAELALSDHQLNGTDELRITIKDTAGAQLFELTAARLIREGVAP